VIGRFPTWVAVVFVLGLIALAAAGRFRLNNIDEFSLSVPHRGPAGYVNVLSLYLLVWFVSGVAHWCLANALCFYSVWKLPQLIVAVSASWALGFVSIFAPAGLGVREAVLYFFVNNWMEQSDIIVFITLSRLMMFGVEVFLTGGFVLYSKLTHEAETAMTN
jgi:hypothetical protein